MPMIPRPPFRRGLTYLAVRPIRLTAAKMVEPGEKVDLPSHRLRSLYLRRRIGPEGHPWTEGMLKSTGFPTPWVNTDKVEEPGPIKWPLLWPIDREIQIPEHNMITTVAELAEVVDEAYEDAESDLTFATTSEEDREHQHDLFVQVIKVELDDEAFEEPEEPEQQEEVTEEPEAEPVEPVKTGSQWTLPGMTGQKFTSKKKAIEWRDAKSDDWLNEGED